MDRRHWYLTLISLAAFLGALGGPAQAQRTADTRLVGGPTVREGILEAYISKNHSLGWGRVCDDDFDADDATVICRQMGFGTDGITYRTRQTYGYYEDFRMNRIDCVGTEAHLSECSYLTYVHNCQDNEQVRLTCPEAATETPTPETPEETPTPETPALPAVGIQAGLVEGDTASFILTRDETAEALTVDVEVSETGTVVAAPPPRTVTFAAGAATAFVQVPTEDDSVWEEDSVLTVDVAEAATYEVSGPGLASVTVRDNDPSLPPTFAATFIPLSAGHGGAAYELELVFEMEPQGMSYRTLKADLSASCGSLSRVQRTPRGQNKVWRLFFHPCAAGAVEVALPTTTLQAADGRTYDGAATITVPE